jgi:hypothetical protein
LKKHSLKNGTEFNGTALPKSARNRMVATSLSPTPRFVMPAKNERKRVTLIVTTTLDHNIELFSLATGRRKTEIGVTALSEFLQRQNIDPTQDRRTAVRDLLQAAVDNSSSQ